MDPLARDLCRLARRLVKADVELFLVGGYGLVLKAQAIRDLGVETVAPTPFPRATEDLDVLLTAEIVADPTRMGAIKRALEGLEYEPIPGREHYQWSRELGGTNRTIKIDILGQVPEDTSSLRMGERRMRPRNAEGLLANPMAEAEFIRVKANYVEVCRDGPPATVALPHPFSYLLLKLHAFDDRKHDERMDFGRHHAFDLYRNVAMMTKREWDEVEELVSDHGESATMIHARGLVQRLFGGPEALGGIRVREHIRATGVDTAGYTVDEFLGDLQELFG